MYLKSFSCLHFSDSQAVILDLKIYVYTEKHKEDRKNVIIMQDTATAIYDMI